METGNNDLASLDAAARATGEIARRPRLAVYVVAATGVALAWLVLGAAAVRGSGTRVPPGPGERLLEGLPLPPLPDFVERFLALCLMPAPPGGPSASLFLALALLWFLMAVAMMLPSAAPLLRTYCEIADTAARKHEPAAHPLVLLSGYLTAWLAAASMFAALTMALQAAAGAGPLDPLLGVAGGSALALAGLYQFSSLKEACLKKCRSPFAILFARWTARPAGIFRLGLEQGAWCVGCCWALMLVMFAVGTMNVLWMALIALFSLLEKQVDGPLATRIAGAILLVWAAAVLVIST